MVRVLIAAWLCLTAAAALGQSTTYRCVDANGRSTYTNIQEETSGKKCTVVSREVSVVPAERVAPVAAVKPPPQANAAARANDRRKILEAELINKQKNLQDARRELAEQENQRLGGERNPVRMQERIEPYARKVKLHEDNIANLQKELANLR